MKKLLLGLGTIAAVAAPAAAVVSCGDKKTGNSNRWGMLRKQISDNKGITSKDNPIIAYKVENAVNFPNMKYLWFQFQNGDQGSIKLDGNGWINTGAEIKINPTYMEKWMYTDQGVRDILPSYNFNLTQGKLDIKEHFDYQGMQKYLADGSYNSKYDFDLGKDFPKRTPAEISEFNGWTDSKYAGGVYKDLVQLDKDKTALYTKSKVDEGGTNILFNVGTNAAILNLDLSFSLETLTIDSSVDTNEKKKNLLLAIAAKEADPYLKILDNIGLKGNTVIFPYISVKDWNGDLTKLLIVRDSTGATKIAPQKSDSNFFSQAELTTGQFVL